MSVTLSSEDLVRLESAMRTLLSPLDHADLDGWRSTSIRATKELLGAERALFWLPVEEQSPMYTEDALEPAFGEYMDYYRGIDEGMEITQRRSLSVLSRQSLCASEPNGLERYHRSEIYNDWFLRHSIPEMMGFYCLDPIAVPGQGLVPSAALNFYDAREDTPEFGDRGLSLLRLLLPSFEAGVRTCMRLAEQRDSLAAALDTLAEGLLVCDRMGRVVHANAALESMLAADAEVARLREKMESLARATAGLLRTGGRRVMRSALPATREVCTARAAYRLRASLLGGELLGPGAAVLVALERLTPELPSEDALRERWGLTRKEAQVALLLAEGKSNEEAAQTLFISPHTAKRHTEQVLRKLGVRSRAEVGPKLLGSGSGLKRNEK